MAAAALNFLVCHQHSETSSVGIRSSFKPFPVINCKMPKISRLSQGGTGTLCIQLSSTRPKIQMTLLDESLDRGKVIIKPSEILVRWSYIADKTLPCPPTAVLLHGILGSRKNWGTCCAVLNVHFLLVDLRCHGDSASITKRGPHTVASAALDVLNLVTTKLFFY
uniref:AB hydrolase-1 domain-containing protein n=1 Tax=Lactuca sativa TaxID=4236 RepID=A0A9R1VVL5_LACSA|nr:hypothetical protein LSAT_V11C400208890 [Lactuca sativa]